MMTSTSCSALSLPVIYPSTSVIKRLVGFSVLHKAGFQKIRGINKAASRWDEPTPSSEKESQAFLDLPAFQAYRQGLGCPHASRVHSTEEYAKVGY